MVSLKEENSVRVLQLAIEQKINVFLGFRSPVNVIPQEYQCRPIIKIFRENPSGEEIWGGGEELDVVECFKPGK